jgi:hypothetical protein
MVSCFEATGSALNRSDVVMCGVLQHVLAQLSASESIMLSQTRHSLARSLPVLLLVYLHSDSRAKVSLICIFRLAWP